MLLRALVTMWVTLTLCSVVLSKDVATPNTELPVPAKVAKIRTFIVKIDGRSITTQQRAGKAAAEPVTYTLDEKAKITIGGKEAKLENLTEGMDVDIVLDDTGKTITSINLQTNRID